MLGLPVYINDIDVSYGLIDQGTSSGIITRSLINSTKLKIQEHVIHNHFILTSSGKTVSICRMFIGDIMCMNKSFGKNMFYIVEDELLPSNELICDLIIGRSILASSDFHHMDLRMGHLYNNNKEIIQCENVELHTIIRDDKERKVLVPIISSSIVSTSSSYIHNDEDNEPHSSSYITNTIDNDEDNETDSSSSIYTHILTSYSSIKDDIYINNNYNKHNSLSAQVSISYLSIINNNINNNKCILMSDFINKYIHEC